MKVDPDIAARHLEAAALEQVAGRLRAEGHAVERPARFEGLRADLVARKAEELLVYEFYVPGSPAPPGWVSETNALRTLVARRKGRFLLTLVSPPRNVRVDVSGLEEARAAACAADPVILGLSADPRVRAVTGVEVQAISVGGAGTDVKGEAAVVVVAYDEDDAAWGDETLPFRFDVTLDRSGRLVSVRELKVELPFGLAEKPAAA